MNGESQLSRDYTAFGLLIRSELGLPELPLAPASGGNEIVNVSTGVVPAELTGPHVSGPGFQIGDDDFLLSVADVARYRVRGGSEIVVEAMAGASERNVRLFLLGTAFGILCHQRGLLPLHANAVQIGKCAVAFAGQSGAGKSTLAGYFHDKGYNVLCDDVCVVSFSSGRPMAWPGIPRLKLRRDSLEALRKDETGLEPVADGVDKYHLPIVPASVTEPLPLARVYLLDEPRSDVIDEITPVTGADALSAIMIQTYRHEFLELMGAARRRFEQNVALLKNVSVFRAPLRRGFDAFAATAERLERHAHSS